jgi:hypothetical protein
MGEQNDGFEVRNKTSITKKILLSNNNIEYLH